jgi:outer membrane protein assembly factor BamB
VVRRIRRVLFGTKDIDPNPECASGMSGERIAWRVDRELASGSDGVAVCMSGMGEIVRNNRAVTVGQLDTNMVALDIATGKEVWKTPIEDWKNVFAQPG